MVINLTQHAATAEQIAAGVVDLAGADLAALKALLTFDELPAPGEIIAAAAGIARLAAQATDGQPASAMIGGAPFLMGPLDAALKAAGITPVYAFSRRESVDQAQPDGSVRKVAVFRHAGFVAGVL